MIALNSGLANRLSIYYKKTPCLNIKFYEDMQTCGQYSELEVFLGSCLDELGKSNPVILLVTWMRFE